MPTPSTKLPSLVEAYYQSTTRWIGGYVTTKRSDGEYETVFRDFAAEEREAARERRQKADHAAWNRLVSRWEAKHRTKETP